ncbi:MAG: antibiotic biosynthesis monooxygenase [Micromonosporaceae bacterium]|nr:antibiotic biosynthesis monooxygenase [Micromonosporaceae bacterium]
MSGLLVLLRVRAPQETPDAVAQAYHRVSRELAGTEGLLGNRLLHELTDEGAYLVLSEWASGEAFHRWEAGTAHRAATAPLRPYQDAGRGRPFGVYEVVASYGRGRGREEES